MNGNFPLKGCPQSLHRRDFPFLNEVWVKVCNSSFKSKVSLLKNVSSQIVWWWNWSAATAPEVKAGGAIVGNGSLTGMCDIPVLVGYGLGLLRLSLTLGPVFRRHRQVEAWADWGGQADRHREAGSGRCTGEQRPLLCFCKRHAPAALASGSASRDWCKTGVRCSSDWGRK